MVAKFDRRRSDSVLLVFLCLSSFYSFRNARCALPALGHRVIRGRIVRSCLLASAWWIKLDSLRCSRPTPPCLGHAIGRCQGAIICSPFCQRQFYANDVPGSVCREASARPQDLDLIDRNQRGQSTAIRPVSSVAVAGGRSQNNYPFSSLAGLYLCPLCGLGAGNGTEGVVFRVPVDAIECVRDSPGWVFGHLNTSYRAYTCVHSPIRAWISCLLYDIYARADNLSQQPTRPGCLRLLRLDHLQDPP